MSPRPAPSPEEIADIASTINGHVLRRQTVQLPAAAMDQMHSAMPGAPGEGLRIFEGALHGRVGVRSSTCGDWLFFLRAEGEGGSLHVRPSPGGPA